MYGLRVPRRGNGNRSGRKKKIILAAGLIGAILIPYLGFFLYAIEEYNSVAYNLDPPDPGTFVAANASRLFAMAMWYEENIAKFHAPHDMIVNTYFNASTEVGVPKGYMVTYDSAEWTGHYLLAEACRYAVHLRDGNTTLAARALANITKMLNGVDKILYVSPNGGMARYAWPVAEYPGDPNNPADNHYLGTWNGASYIYEDDTSRDMHNGIIMGLGFTFLLVDDPTTRATVKRLVERMLDVLQARGWLYLNPTDIPNGTDLDVGFWVVGTPGLWTLAYLKVGELVNPEKYGPVYHEYAIERDYLHRANLPYMSRMSVIHSYYGLLLDWEVLFVLNMLETDPNLRRVYTEYIKIVFNFTKYDRNALFNAMWLIINGKNRVNVAGDATIIGDIEDCLMRYYGASQRFPGRNVNITNPGVESPIANKWLTFFRDGIGGTLYPFWQYIFEFENISSVALTPDKRPYTDFLWSRPPYWYEAVNQDGRHEGPSVDFTVVYWLCRYYGIVEAPADFEATISVSYGGG